MATGLDYALPETNRIIREFGSSVDTAIVAVNRFSNAVADSGRNMTLFERMIDGTRDYLKNKLPEAIVAFVGDSVSAYQKLRDIDAQNMVTLTNSGGAVGRTLTDLKNSANALSNTTLFDPAATAEAQHAVLAFGKVRGVIFDQAIPAIQDMAQSMAGSGEADLKGAAERVGAALDNPKEGLKGLVDAGADFSDSQTEAILKMTEQKDLAGAQGLILNTLKEQFGGSAIAAREAAGGQADFDMSVKNLQVGLGGLLETGLKPFLSFAGFLVDTLKSTVDWFVANKEVAGSLTVGLATLGAGLLTYQGYLLLTQAPMTILTAAQWAMNAALNANPIGFAIAALAALGVGVVVAYKHLDNFRAMVEGVWNAGLLAGEVFTGLGKIFRGAFSDKDMFFEGLKETSTALGKIANGGLGEAYTEGYNKSMAKSAAAEKEKKEKEGKITQGVNGATLTTPPSTFTYGDADTGKRNNTTGLPGGRPVPVAETVSTAVPVGSQVRNVQVTIGKLVENLTIATTTLQDNGSMDIKRIITEILTGAVHDSELVLGS
ncbi:hypothetical protein ACSBL2_24535 [Pedobacter sp. AW31-3R]|uniref:hypothetical protein n=1 Tax=Pedobacter sp. AW31-3R TaxID=3445781 RepID=UPI003F9ED992